MLCNYSVMSNTWQSGHWELVPLETDNKICDRPLNNSSQVLPGSANNQEREKERKSERDKWRRREGEKERPREGEKERGRNAKALYKNHASLAMWPSFPNVVRIQADATGRVIQAAANSLFNVSFLVASMLFFRWGPIPSQTVAVALTAKRILFPEEDPSQYEGNSPFERAAFPWERMYRSKGTRVCCFRIDLSPLDAEALQSKGFSLRGSIPSFNTSPFRKFV